MRKVNKPVFFLGMFIAFVVIGALAYAAVAIYHYFYGMHLVSSGEYAPVVEAGEYNLIYEGEYVQKAIKVDDQFYLDMDLINEEWAEGMLFYAEDVNKVYYTTPS